MRRAEAPEEVAELKHGSSGDILALGSRTNVEWVLVARFVGELHVLVGPALLGNGAPMYGGRRGAPAADRARVLSG